MKKVNRFKCLLLVIVFLLSSIFNALFVNVVNAAYSINNDTVNKKITITNDLMTMVVNYNNMAKIESLKINNVETLESIEGIHSSVQVGSSWIGTANLTISPSVSVNGNIVTISNISYSNTDLQMNETWTFTVSDNNIQIKLDKQYHWLTSNYDSVNQCSFLVRFKEKAFDVIQRTEDGGSFILLDKDRERNRFLDEDNQVYGLKSANMDFIDKFNNFILSINMDTNRNKAVEIYRSAETTKPLKVEYKMSSAPFEHILYDGVIGTVGYHFAYKSTQNIFKNVKVGDYQTDTATFTFSAENNINKYYDLGTIPAASGVDEYKLAQYLQDFGRSSVIDYDEGMGDCQIENPIGMGPYETYWYAANAIALQSTGNEKYLDTLKNFVRFVINTGGQRSDGHVKGRTVGNYTQDPGWGGTWGTDSLYDADPQYVLGICDIFGLSQDINWLYEVKSSARAAIDYMLTRDSDNNGLYENSVDYTSQQIAGNEWNDATYISFESAYVNALMYGALVEWADIEEQIFNDTTRASYYRNKAVLLKTQYNKDISQGGFWSNLHNSYVYWRDRDGTVHGDVKQLPLNGFAIIFGIADSTRANTIMSDLETFMVNNSLNAYPMNLYGMASNEGQSVNYPFPNYLNGGILLQNHYEVMGAYAKVGNGSLLLKYLKNAIDRYFTDGLWDGNFYTWDMSIYGYEKWMSSGVRPAVGFYRFMLGIEPQYYGLQIDPVLDSSLYGTEVNYTLRGNKYKIKYDGSLVRTIHKYSSTEPFVLKWRSLSPSSVYYIVDENLTTSTTTKYKMYTDSAGELVYNLLGSGQHRVTVSSSEPVNAPSPPLLKSVIKGNGSVTLYFNKVEGASSYNIKYGTSSGSYTTTITDVATDSYTVTGLTNGQTYYFAVSAVMSGVEGVNSNEKLVSLTPPAAPVLTSALRVDGSNSITIKFNQVPGADYYKIKYGTSSGNYTSTISNVTGTSYTVNFLNITTQYYFVITAVNAIGESPNSNQRTAVTDSLNHALNVSGTGYPTPLASYTYWQDSEWKAVDGNDGSDGSRTRWTCYGSGNTTDWLAVDFGASKKINKLKMNIYNDGVGVKPPSSYNVQYWNGSTWVDAANQTKYPSTPSAGENEVVFDMVNTQKVRVVFMHQNGSYSGVNELRLYSPINLALNTSETGYPAPSASYTYWQDSVWDAVDGNPSTADNPRTRWTCYGSGNTTDWYSIDLGTNKIINKISMYVYDDGDGVKAPVSYNLQYWNGSGWVDVPSQRKYPVTPSAGENTVIFDIIDTSRIRAVFTHQAGSYSGLTEFRVFEPSGMLSVSSVTTSTSIEGSDWGKDRVLNGNRYMVTYQDSGWTSNYYTDANHNEWISVDIGQQKRVGAIVLFPRNYSGSYGGGFPADFTIQVSADNSTHPVNWTTVLTKTNYSVINGGDGEIFSFTPVSVRHIRVNATKLSQIPSDNNYYRFQLAEIELYNNDSD